MYALRPVDPAGTSRVPCSVPDAVPDAWATILDSGPMPDAMTCARSLRCMFE